MPDSSEFTTLLEVLCGKDLQGLVEIRGFKHGRILQKWADNIPDADSIVHSFEDTWEVYFGVNPRETKEGDDSAISKVVTVVADLDYKRFPTVSDCQNILQYAGIPPTAVVESGGGLHVYWALQTPAANTEEFKAIRKQFISLVNSDWVQDAARILRVPGTQNHKYDELRTVRLTEVDASRRYTPEIFQKVPSLPEEVRRTLFSGALGRYKSRSERDWKLLWSLVRAKFTPEEIMQVMLISPAGDRYRERWPILIQHDLDQVKVDIDEGSDDPFQITVRDNCFFVRSEKGERQLSTFVFEPHALLQPADDNDEDYISGTVKAEGTTYEWTGVTLPKKAFVDRRALARFLPVAAWTWLGTDQDVVRLLPFLMKTIQARDIPILRAVKTLGRYSTVWVTDNNIITPTAVRSFAEAGYIYQNTKRERPQVEYEFINSLAYRDLVQNIYKLLPEFNEPRVIWPIIAWYFASVYKPVLGVAGREFPILMLAGTRGAGKTATVKSIMLPLLGHVSPRTYNCDTTEFVMLSLMSSTSSIPIAFSEYRSDINNSDRFTRRLRLAYDTGVDIRGRADQTTVSYPLCAPVSLDGEDEIEDSAFRERAVIVRLHPEDITPPRREAFYDLSELPLYHFAAPYIQFSLNFHIDFEAAYKMVHSLLGDDVSDRILANMSKLVVGLFSYCEFGKQHGAVVPEVTKEFLRDVVFTRVLETLFLGDTGRTRTLVDSFVEDSINEVLRSGLGLRVGKATVSYDPFVWRYDPEANAIYLHLSTAYNWWISYRRRLGMPSGTSASIKAQLRERTGGNRRGQYVRGKRSVALTGGKSIYTYKIDLAEAAATGLDVPSSLRTISIASAMANPVAAVKEGA